MDHGTVVIQQPVTQPAMHPTTTAVHNNASSPRSIAVTRGLGIAQIVIGALTVLLAILTTALLHYWVGYIGFGIWGGIWVCILDYLRFSCNLEAKDNALIKSSYVLEREIHRSSKVSETIYVFIPCPNF